MKKVQYLTVFLSLGLFCIVNNVQAVERVEYKHNSIINCSQSEVIDICFYVKNIPDHPFDINFLAYFKHRNSKTLIINGFHNGKNEYVIRFCPPKPGDWHLETSSNITELNQLKTKLYTEEAKNGRKGRIKVSNTNKKEFSYENGENYFPIAFEADMIFALDAENDADIPKTRRLINDLSKNGFNQLVMNVYAYDAKWGWEKDSTIKPEFEYGEPKIFPFGGTNNAPDHSTLNPNFFKKLDRIIDYLDKKGIAAHLMIYVWNKFVNWPTTESVEDNRYYDYVVKRYQAFPNIIWDISKEALAYGQDDMGYITRRIERLRNLDAYNNLVTVHSFKYCYANRDKVDFISVQNWSTEIYHVMKGIRNQFPDQPIISIEHGGYVKGPYNVFPGSYTDPVINLERAYKCVFAGTYPSLYWQGASWNVIIHEPEKLDPEFQPYYEYYMHLSTLADKYKISALESGKTHSNSGLCLNNGKDLYLFFVPKESIAIGPYLPKQHAGKKIKGTWFNPLDGTFGEPEKKINKGWPKFPKPDHNHFDILIIEILP